jgi:HlyD family secretion protein
VSLGTCGLYIQFDSTEWYKNEDWVIEIPNKRGSSYIENLNAYTLALKEQEHTIALATQELDLVRKTAGLENAVPTHEAREQADARIAQAAAIVSAKEAHIADRVIKAPFDGVITDISMKVGEVSDNTKTITLIQNGSYVFKARIPEVDIRKIAVGNTATVLFDAAPNEPIPALIEYISPTSIEIDGVAYYEARLKLSYVPIWIREGLNADVDIVVEKRDQVLVLPKRFIIQEGDTYYAHVLHDVRPVKTELRTGLVGNDGFVEVQNISEGATVVIP